MVLEAGRQIEIDKPSEYFLQHRIGIEKVNIYGVPQQEQQPLLQALERSGVAAITEGAGIDVQFSPSARGGPMRWPLCFSAWDTAMRA